MTGFTLLLRRLRGAPVFALTAIGSIAIGIAANSAIFSYVIDVYWRALPLVEPARLALLWETLPGGDVSRPTTEVFEAWHRNAKSFEHIGALQAAGWALTDGVGVAERVRGGWVTADLPAVFRFKIGRGRGFGPEDFRPGAPAVVILSHHYWVRRFGSDPEIMGRRIAPNQVPHVVIGVFTPDSTFSPDSLEVLAPLILEGATAGQRASRNKFVLARLAPGVTFAAAQAELDLLARQRAAASPETHRGMGAAVKTIDEWIGFQPEDRRAVLLMWFAMGCVQLIVCGNLASLLLARAVARRKELAVRAALGADAARLSREFLGEALLLATAGGGVGVVLAFWISRLLAPFMPALPMGLTVHEAFDWRVPVFGFAAALGSGVIFGLLPAWSASRVNLNEALNDSTRGGSGGRHARRLGAWLVGAEVAVACLLLSTAAAIGESVWKLRQIPLGFEPRGVCAIGLALPSKKYPTDDAIVAFTREVAARAAALPGVTQVTLSTRLPLGGYPMETFSIAGQPRVSVAERPRAQVQAVGPGYERVLGVPLLRGRGFAAADRQGAPPVALINRALADKWFPGADPIGRLLEIDLPVTGRERADGPSRWEIVGVLGNVKGRGEAFADYEMIYLPFEQRPLHETLVVFRTTGAVENLAGPLRAIVAALDRDVLADRFDSLRANAENLRREPRQRAALIGGFAVVALFLATLGVYGVSACGVAQRAREFGIRMALGAQPGDVLRLVLRQSLVLTAAGVAGGLALSIGAGVLLKSVLFGVGALNPWALAAAALALAAAAIAATWIPARRAVRVDPTVALRNE